MRVINNKIKTLTRPRTFKNRTLQFLAQHYIYKLIPYVYYTNVITLTLV